MSAEQSLNWSDEDQEDTEAPQQDSRVLRELRKVNSGQAKRIRELEEKLTSFTKESRGRTVKELLASRDLNPKIAAFIPEDVEATEESLGKWLDEYGDVFGGSKPAESDGPPHPSIATLRQMDNVSAATQSSVSGNDLMAAIASAQTREDLDAIIARGVGR